MADITDTTMVMSIPFSDKINLSVGQSFKKFF